MDQLINIVAQLAVPIVVCIVAILITRGIVPEAQAWLQAHLDIKEQALIEHIIDIAVRSAEAERLRAELENAAYSALDKAIEMAAGSLARYEITLDQKELRAAILAALHRLRQWPLQTSWVQPADGDEPAGERALLTEAPESLKRQWWL